ncbi:ABC transporter, fused permease protein [Methylomonas albis]|uniref:FtsX-like permease family protein n=1 Tax=Methylomonas albis TaxID=1854563 RepID=A0ABR9D5I4_9GAMM|nr:FtsX-like permease family protein [Methylomonas albis]MBD9358350.1 FtsX-like permease family protein [Methylomonas albis]CAD6881741.1 ABC transporter, fused permease protein [Methylomonas albis]
MKRFNLALKLLWRDSRSGELTLLLMALLIAVSSSTAISLFADRLQRTMNLQAAEFLAGDLVVATPATIDDLWLEKAAELRLAQSQTSEFASVLLENGEMLLAAVKSVSSGYPLRGQLKTNDADSEHDTLVKQGPESGTVWVDKRVLPALKLKIGDALTIGEKALTISRVLSYEPDKRGDIYSFSPRVMINQTDLVATGVIQPGSRVRYAYQFSGDEQALATFKDWLKPQLNPSQKILDIHEDRPELGSALERAERYLGLSSIVVILIAGVAIAMATRRYTERHFNATALLRCLGCKQAEILWLYGCQFLVLGLLASGVGCGVGWLAQFGLFELLKSLLPQQLANPSWLAVFFGLITGLAILLGFALPPLLRLQNVSPLRVLRRELEPLPTSGWLIYGLALAIIGTLIWRYTEDPKMTGTILGVGMLALLGLGAAIYGLLLLARKLLPRMGLNWRFGLQGLLRNSQASISQILAFSITLTAMALSFTVRSDLIDNWQQQLPEQAPNHFALNILPERQQAFQDQLQQAQIPSSPFYPVVRGRLVTINDEAVQGRVSKDTQGEGATQRELSLTWAAQLPDDNKTTAGGFWQAEQPGLVSVEQKLAESLNIKMGDQLTFTVGSAQFSAKVAHIRSVQWDTMRPNFYMIFSPGTLDNFPTTYMTSFYLVDTQKNLLNTLLKKYPAITILEVDQILKQFKMILTQLTKAINLLLYFALAAGFTVLFAAVYATLDQRIYEGALMRTLGARRGFLRATHVIEFGLLGTLSGVLAALASEAILYALYTRVMHIDYRPNFQLWAALPAIGAICVGLAGYWGVRQVVRQPPLQVLRR